MVLEQQNLGGRCRGRTCDPCHVNDGKRDFVGPDPIPGFRTDRIPPAGRNWGKPLTASHQSGLHGGSLTQTKWPPQKPGWFTLPSGHFLGKRRIGSTLLRTSAQCGRYTRMRSPFGSYIGISDADANTRRSFTSTSNRRLRNTSAEIGSSNSTMPRPTDAPKVYPKAPARM